MTIKLYNTATRSKVDFKPLDADNVRMYVCGPTVYDRAHLGNARPVLVFDILNRLLRHTYGEDKVTYVRNFTDVDDKINATAVARKEAGAKGTLEDLVRERSDETIAWYHADMDALGAKRPDHEPRATDYIAQMIAMIEGLIDKDYAYAAEGHALFRVRAYKDYGQLSGRSVDDMIAGARVEVAPFKEDPMDFVLWKPSTDDLPGWDSPWGRGRPGWHIECSAMADELLMQDPKHEKKFDIHGGGNDLTFPHHENEIAQSKCVGHGFAQVWMHNEMLQVEGKKMSKSLGNFFTVRDLLDQGVPGEVIRFVMLSTHYRKPMDWTEKKREEARTTLKKWYSAINGIGRLGDEFYRSLSDDLNTPDAITALHYYFSEGRYSELHGGMWLLGLLDSGIPNWVSESIADLDKIVDRFVAWRAYFRISKQFEWADAIRDKLSVNAITLRDLPGGETEFEINYNKLRMDFVSEVHSGIGDHILTMDQGEIPRDSQLIARVKDNLQALEADLWKRFPNAEVKND